MRLLLLFSAAALSTLALQSGFFHWFPIDGVIPDLVLVLAVDLGLNHAGVLTAFMAFMMGYGTDALSGSQIGLNCFMLTLVFLLSYEVSRQFKVTNNLIGSITVFFAVLLHVIGGFTVTRGFVALHSNESHVIRLALTEAIVTALIAPILFSLLARGKMLLGLSERERD